MDKLVCNLFHLKYIAVLSQHHDILRYLIFTILSLKKMCRRCWCKCFQFFADVNPATVTLQITVLYQATTSCQLYISLKSFTTYITSRCDNVWDANWGFGSRSTQGLSNGQGCAALLANQIVETCVSPSGYIPGNVELGRKKRQTGLLSPSVTITIPNVP